MRRGRDPLIRQSFKHVVPHGLGQVGAQAHRRARPKHLCNRTCRLAQRMVEKRHDPILQIHLNSARRLIQVSPRVHLGHAQWCRRMSYTREHRFRVHPGLPAPAQNQRPPRLATSKPGTTPPATQNVKNDIANNRPIP